MRVFVGGVTSETGHSGCIETFLNIRLQPGDYRKLEWMGRGDTNRADLSKEFLARKEFDALFLCDVDMAFKPGVLDRLRSHDLDCVSGHYFRRRYNPMVSIATVLADGRWPYLPLWDIPDDGLIEVTTVGFGCALIKRRVIEDVQATQPPGTPCMALGPLPEMTKGDHTTFGSDFRFWALARGLGYKVWLDCNPEAEAAHAATVFLTRELYKTVRGTQLEKAADYWTKVYTTILREQGMDAKAADARIKQLEQFLAQYERELDDAKSKVEEYTARVAVVTGQIAERKIDLEKKSGIPVFASKEEAEKAMTNRTRGPEGMGAEEMSEGRTGMHRKIAADFLDAATKDDEPAA